MAKVRKEKMWDWLFNYNPYRESWFAFRRQDSVSYFNGSLSRSKILQSKYLDILQGKLVMKLYLKKNNKKV